ncbi:MAG: hypothetical protein ACFWTZ_08465 [Burkholderia sp.]|jgi:hypothetical protein
MAKLTPEEFDRKYGPFTAMVTMRANFNADEAVFGKKWMEKHGHCLEDGTLFKPIKKTESEKSSDKGKTTATEKAKP